MTGKKTVLAALALISVFGLRAADYYADSALGSDGNDGLSPERAFRTLEKATRLLKAGDTLHLKAGAVFNERLYFHSSGSAFKPIRVKGNGAVISGLKRVSDSGWRNEGGDLWLSTNKMFWGACRPRVWDRELKMISVEIGDAAFSDPRLLKAGQAAWNGRGIWFRCDPGRKPQDYALSGSYLVSGVEVVNKHHWVVEDLTAEYFTNDGFNVHGVCRGLYFLNIAARRNGDDGFSIHGDEFAAVHNLHTSENDFGVSDISRSQSTFCGLVAVSNRLCGVDFHGGMRIVRDGIVKDNGNCEISVSTSARGESESDPNPMLRASVYFENVTASGAGTAMAVRDRCTVTAAKCRFAGAGEGLRLEGGRVHLEKCEVEDCKRALVKSPKCELSLVECKGL
jgi:hypothetical protein